MVLPRAETCVQTPRVAVTTAGPRLMLPTNLVILTDRVAAGRTVFFTSPCRTMAVLPSMAVGIPVGAMARGRSAIWRPAICHPLRESNSRFSVSAQLFRWGTAQHADRKSDSSPSLAGPRRARRARPAGPAALFMTPWRDASPRTSIRRPATTGARAPPGHHRRHLPAAACVHTSRNSAMAPPSIV